MEPDANALQKGAAIIGAGLTLLTGADDLSKGKIPDVNADWQQTKIEERIEEASRTTVSSSEAKE